MKKLFLLLLLLPLWVYGQQAHPWLHIYHNDVDFNSVKATEITEMTHRLSDSDDSLDSLIVNTKENRLSVALSDIDRCAVGTNVPTVYITIPDYPNLSELYDKELYLDAMISIDGNGVVDDLEPTAVSIKGRGNSTWNYVKKPYRLKFDKKIAICGLAKAKSYALIANYIDCTLMRNAIALKIGQLLEMPYTNHCQPIRVYFNGIFKGAYFITEKIGITGASVDIDEETGILFEMDTNFDEDYKFWSRYYNLPMMVKDPDLSEIAELKGVTPESLLTTWGDDFTEFERKVFMGEDLSTSLDMESLVNYLIVYNVCGNREPVWPKSVYLYKASAQDVYHFGPIWDFDWGFTYNDGVENQVTDKLLLEMFDYPQYGGPFLMQISKTPEFRALYKEKFDHFKTELYPLLLEYMDEYADQIEPSAIENGVVWPVEPGRTEGSFNFRENLDKLKEWIQNRIDFISGHENYGLYN
ncbi:CotH kinase family protein [Barnesiella sp. ET7]|uniref:CotH kinase family protein n=1 Tax=Barnesiella sp. ET7 TaxID=2972460 RepID=UPI0021AC2F26|nr:CotH kinase family protein [Barnesiella sp. ET7]MCR8910954.1 CotH kinase family protein [Barnesiella sp. ET7]